MTTTLTTIYLAALVVAAMVLAFLVAVAVQRCVAYVRRRVEHRRILEEQLQAEARIRMATAATLLRMRQEASRSGASSGAANNTPWGMS